jgi:hypothetical protein
LPECLAEVFAKLVIISDDFSQLLSSDEIRSVEFIDLRRICIPTHNPMSKAPIPSASK